MQQKQQCKQHQKPPGSFVGNKFKAVHLYLMERNYTMAYSANNGLFLVTLLFIIREFQILSLISLNKDERFLIQIPNLQQVFQIVKIFTGQFDHFAQNKEFVTNQQLKVLKLWLSMCFFCLQVLSLVVSLLPCSSPELNKLFSKLITIQSIILPIPTASYFCKTFLAYIQNNPVNEDLSQLCISTSSFIIMVINHFIFTNFHYAFSIKEMSRNKLTRFPRGWMKQFGWIILALIHPFSVNYFYPNLFIVYACLYLIFGCYEGKKYAIEFEYLDAKLCRNIGVLCLLNITLAIGMLSCFLGISLFINGLTSFIIAFYLFFVHFFFTFRKFWIKRIIIDDNTTTQVSQITYVTTFIVFLCDISQKKNKTYISSLLKNHCNNCNQLGCCCKNRSIIYDPSQQMFGNAEKQPHLDGVFIKHFYLKMIQDSIIQFQKSVNLKLLLCLFYLQFFQLSPLCIKQIQYLNKKSIIEKLSVQEKFSLFCLQKQFKSFLAYDNYKKGDKKIQNVKIFDHNFNILTAKITQINSNFKFFWQLLNSNQQQQENQSQHTSKHKQNIIDADFLSTISINTIKIMEQIENLYKQMKHINPNSLKFKQIMFYYSKQVINDMDFFLKIKQDLKIEKISHNNKDQVGNVSKKELKIYGQNSANFVFKDINSIKWASNNAKQIFGFKKHCYLVKSNITDLMPVFFAKEHDLNVKNWLQTGKCLKMNKTSTIWCKKQNGSCFKALIYIKVMPNFVNSSDKFIQYYTSIEKIGSNQIICGLDGQIYGCDQNFKTIMKCPMKVIQNSRLNIQIFFPLLSQYFIHYFYQQIIDNKRKYEDTFSGYIPTKTIDLIQNITKQKEALLQKVKKTKNYGQSYGLFVETKMQQITIYMKGSYVTIDVQVSKQKMINRELIIIKIIRIQKNTVQKYYNQFQKTIKMLKLIKDQNLAKTQHSYTHCNSNQHNRSPQKSPLDLFNPKKIKKLNFQNKKLKEESKQGKTLIGQQSKNIQENVHPEKNQIQRVTLRKKRAINKQDCIKNQRVRRTIQLIKKTLYDHKIFSENTMKILNDNKITDGKQRKNGKDSNVFIIQQQYSSDPENQEQKQENTVEAKKSIKTLLKKNKYRLKNRQYDQQQQLLLHTNSSSEQNGQPANCNKTNTKKLDQIKMMKQQDEGLSFQESTTSSAAFISLSTKIKLLKKKLRQVKAKPLLVVCCSIFIGLLVIGNILNIINTIEQKSILEAINIGQQSKYRSYRLLQSMMLNKILWLNRGNIQSLGEKMEQYQKELQQITKRITISQLAKYTGKGNKQAKIRQNIYVDFMQIFIRDPSRNNDLIPAYTFLLRQYASLFHFTPSKSIRQYSSIIRQLINRNIYSNNREINLPNIVYIVPFLIITNIYILTSVLIASKRVKCITKLISDLYQHQKRKYLRYYTKIEKKINFMLSVGNVQLQLPMDKSKTISKGDSHKRVQSKQIIINSTNLLIGIIIIFVTIYASIFFIYLYTHKLQQSIKQQQSKFDGIVISQLTLSYRLLMFLDYHCSKVNNDQIPKIVDSDSEFESFVHIPEQLISIYNQPTTTFNIRNVIQQFNSNNLCDRMQPPYLSLLFQNQELRISQLPSKIREQCQQIGQNLLKSGPIKSIPFVYQHISYYNPPQPKPNSSIISTLSHTQTIVFILAHQTLFRQFLQQKYLQNSQIYYTWSIITGALLLLSLFLVIVWGYIYRKVSSIYSGFNCYLLMLPFEVMIENPYIRHYLKEQLGFKSNLY